MKTGAKGTASDSQNDSDASTRILFYAMMGLMAAAMLYFVALLFFM